MMGKMGYECRINSGIRGPSFPLLKTFLKTSRGNILVLLLRKIGGLALSSAELIELYQSIILFYFKLVPVYYLMRKDLP
jgi:hypothetical protein